MAYTIPVDQNIARHRKTIRMAEELGQHRWFVVGLLGDVWGWGIEHTKDGIVVPERDATSLAKHLGVRSTYVRRLLDSMVLQGWLDPVSTDSQGSFDGASGVEKGVEGGSKAPAFRFHEWEKYGGKVVAAREEDALRKRLWREHIKGLHATPVKGCRKCRRSSSTGRGGERPVDTYKGEPPASTGRPPDSPDPVHPYTRAHGDRRASERTSPIPPATSSGQGQDAGLLDDQVGELMRRAGPRWGSVLTALLMGGMTRANLATWLKGTTVEDQGDVAIVRVPNAFALEWLRSRYRGQIARALEQPTSRVVFALDGETVQLEPEPVDEA